MAPYFEGYNHYSGYVKKTLELRVYLQKLRPPKEEMHNTYHWAPQRKEKEMVLVASC